MKAGILRLHVRVLVVIVSQIALYGCATHADRLSERVRLLNASRTAGVQIHQDEVFSISRGTQSFSTAPIARLGNRYPQPRCATV